MTKETHQNGLEQGHNVPVFKIAESVLAGLKSQPVRDGLATVEVVMGYNDSLSAVSAYVKLAPSLPKLGLPRSEKELNPNADHAVLASAVASDEATGTQVRVDILQGPYSSQRRIQVFAQRMGATPPPLPISPLIPKGEVEHPGASK